MLRLALKNPIPQKWLSGLGWELGLDMGSSNTMIYVKDRGVVIEEPTIIAQPRKKRWTGLTAPKTSVWRPIAFGFKAKEMLSREPKQIEVVSPICRGLISDFEACQNLISYYLKLIYEIPSRYPKLLKPRVLIGVPNNINRVQKRAFKSIFKEAGVREVVLVESAVLAALGLGMTVDKLGALLLVDVGGGKTEVNLISMGGVVNGKSIDWGSGDLDETIINFIKMKYGILIGKNSAERVKIEIGRTAEEEDKEKFCVVRGRDLGSGLPRSIKVGEGEISEALAMPLSKIPKLVNEVLNEAPPELMGDILKRGIVMIGNGSRLKGLGKLIETATKINTRLASEPGWCVVRGCGELVESSQLLKTIKIVSGI